MTASDRAAVVTAGAAEAVVIVLYIRFDAPFHLVLHFLVGASAALVLRALAHAFGWYPAPAGVWMVRGHIVALVPDLLFRAGLPHAHWMDFFLWHIEAHFLPGRLTAWGVVFLAAFAADRWTEPRRPIPAIAAFDVLAAAVVVAHTQVPSTIEAGNHVTHLVTMAALPALAIAALAAAGVASGRRALMSRADGGTAADDPGRAPARR